MRRVWLLCLTKCSSALIAVGYALLMQRTVDAAVARDTAAFWPALALFAAALLTQVALMAASKWIAESAQARIENALRAHACKNILDIGRLPKGQATGEIATVLTSDATYVAESLVSILPEASSMTVRAIAALALMFSVAPALAGLFVIAGAICVVLSLFMRRWLKRLHTTAQEAEGSMRALSGQARRPWMGLTTLWACSSKLASAEPEAKRHRASCSISLCKQAILRDSAMAAGEF